MIRIRTSLRATSSLTVNPPGRRVSMGLSRLPSPVLSSSTQACDRSWCWFTTESLQPTATEHYGFCDLGVLHMTVSHGGSGFKVCSLMSWLLSVKRDSEF